MEDRSKQNNPQADPRDVGQNPGLKGKEVKGDGKKYEGLFNEDPMEEKRAVEETSEDRLSEAE